MKRVIVVSVLMLMAIGGNFTTATAQGWEQGITIIAPHLTKYIERGLRGIVDGGGPVCIMGGRWWYVQYQDGTVVANEFRRGRTLKDILDHVKYGRGACDWRDQYGRTVCYNSPQRAVEMARVHGPIVGIRN